ncbi:MAG: polyprenyl synthetase family protein [Pseudomonadota bacterium]
MTTAAQPHLATPTERIGASALRSAIDDALASFCDELQLPAALHDVGRYVLLSPGKRVRGILCLNVANASGLTADDTMASAVAVEAVHAASLVLDDLPAMDNSVLRRGQPSAHCAFDEARAVLVAIALLNGAYGHLARHASDDRAAVAYLARAVGGTGLVGGQIHDLYPGEQQDLSDVETTHGAKTGALFAAALALGGRNCSAPDRELLWAAGYELGVAFQGYDDLLDHYAVSDVIGKETGADATKTTVASLLSRAQAEAWCAAKIAEAEQMMQTVLGGGHALQDYVEAMHRQLTAPLRVKL